MVCLVAAILPSIISAERAYPLGCSTKDPKYYDFESTSFPPTEGVPIKSTHDYMLVRRLGAGKFSDVFEAVDVQLEQQLVPTASSEPTKSQPVTIDKRTLVVLKCLKHASNLPNLARLLAVVVPGEYHDSNKKYQLQSMPSLVLEHAGVDSQWLCHSKDHNLSEEEIRYFLYHLLVALDQLHSSGYVAKAGWSFDQEHL
jgi:casein kinase II subunit alpha